jgi:hypothetical protein
MDLPIVDVLIPTAGSAAGLGATLASLANQRYPSFRVTAAWPHLEGDEAPWLAGLVRVLEARGHAVRLVDAGATSLEGGRAQALLDRAAAEYVLVVEDGVFLEADLLGRLVAGIRASGSAFVGSNVVDLRFRDEHRPEEEAIEFWDGPVRPEEIRVATRGWARRKVHRGANLQHLRERLPRTRDRLYRVADIGGCVLYDTARLRSIGGFRPERDPRRSSAVPASNASASQLRLLERYGGAGLFPSGAYRLTTSTTLGTGTDASLEASARAASASAPRARSHRRGPSRRRLSLARMGSRFRTALRRHAGTPGIRRNRRRGPVA